MEEAQKFVAEKKETYGDNFALNPMSKEIYESVEPIEEMIQMRGAK